MWSGLLRLVLAIIPIVKWVMRWRSAQAEKERAKELAEAAINKVEVKASRDVAEVFAERRDDDAATKRLRDSTF